MNTSFSLYIKLRLCAACPSTTHRNLSARHQLGHNQTSSIPIPICKKCKAASAETCFISLLVVPTCRAVGSPRCGLGWTLVEGVNCPQSTELCLTVLSLCYTREWQDWRPFQLFIFFFFFFLWNAPEGIISCMTSHGEKPSKRRKNVFPMTVDNSSAMCCARLKSHFFKVYCKNTFFW